MAKVQKTSPLRLWLSEYVLAYTRSDTHAATWIRSSRIRPAKPVARKFPSKQIASLHGMSRCQLRVNNGAVCTENPIRAYRMIESAKLVR